MVRGTIVKILGVLGLALVLSDSEPTVIPRPEPKGKPSAEYQAQGAEASDHSGSTSFHRFEVAALEAIGVDIT